MVFLNRHRQMVVFVAIISQLSACCGKENKKILDAFPRATEIWMVIQGAFPARVKALSVDLLASMMD